MAAVPPKLFGQPQPSELRMSRALAPSEAEFEWVYELHAHDAGGGCCHVWCNEHSIDEVAAAMLPVVLEGRPTHWQRPAVLRAIGADPENPKAGDTP